MRDAKKRETAARILSGARQLFLRNGYAGTSVEDIAAAAGISRAGLFNYYKGKPAILEALAMRLEPRLVQMVQHYMARPGTTGQRIEALFAHSARVLEQTAGLTRLLLVHGDRAAEFPELLRVFGQMVEAGQRSGELRDDFSADALAETIYMGYIAGLLGWARSTELSLSEQFSRRARLISVNLQSRDS
jgi:AcrR family transcriptional regulator